MEAGRGGMESEAGITREIKVSRSKLMGDSLVGGMVGGGRARFKVKVKG